MSTIEARVRPCVGELRLRYTIYIISYTHTQRLPTNEITRFFCDKLTQEVKLCKLEIPPQYESSYAINLLNRVPVAEWLERWL